MHLSGRRGSELYGPSQLEADGRVQRLPALLKFQARLTHLEDSLLARKPPSLHIVEAIRRPVESHTYYRVTIFGSSRMHRGDQLYLEVRRLAKHLSELGCDIITGAVPA